ncbi:hypothetical protein Y1Q_0011909 [Alligator mississippiensis]|uniref:Uncharacterized protein n=1 Tax=Alligator mississippiensis TaxID=8496 RepID=A0A151P6C3_ALLMI|nr:hypothetical protein Y1Q_0011909 [Alligator mississippiensis]
MLSLCKSSGEGLMTPRSRQRITCPHLGWDLQPKTERAFALQVTDESDEEPWACCRIPGGVPARQRGRSAQLSK